MALLLSVFYIMADAFVYMPIRYLMFKEKLRYSYSKTMSFLFAIALMEGVLYYFLQNMVTSNVTNYLFRVIFMAVYISLSFYFINDNWQKVMFLALLFVPVGFTGVTVSGFFEIIVIPGLYAENPMLWEIIVKVIFALIMYYPLYQLFDKMLKPIMDIDAKNCWQVIWLVPGVFSVITLFVSRSFLPPEKIVFISLVRLSVLIGCFVCCVSLSRTAKLVEENTFQKAQAENMKQLMQLQEKQYEKISNHIGQLRKNNHDARHHIRALMSLANEGNLEEIKIYLAGFIEKIPSGKGLFFCNDLMLNAILEYYFSYAKSRNIPMNIKADVPEKVFDSADLSVLVGNLIENAVEAQENLADGEKFINLKIKTFEDKIYFVVENAFDGVINTKNGQYLSHKRDNKTAGIGLQSVREIVKKYNGELAIDTDNKIFKCSAMLESI
ncbi:MAG: GHKL domain-containing protein [Clostridia bacterium]|nr:GHKL domain-containing protein [Clostridia bacterium]